jgi:hypothetical protein
MLPSILNVAAHELPQSSNLMYLARRRVLLSNGQAVLPCFSELSLQLDAELILLSQLRHTRVPQMSGPIMMQDVWQM